jgi:hypothetical protein
VVVALRNKTNVRSIGYTTPLAQHEIDNFFAAGWLLLRHQFSPGIGSGVNTREEAEGLHEYTFVKVKR